MRFALRRRRLLRLIKAIEAQDKFTMNVWAVHTGEHRPSRRRNFCGTAACALGTAALVPEFQKAGLDIQWAPQRLDPVTGRPMAWHGQIVLRDPDYPRRLPEAGGIHAGQCFFGLSDRETWLFLQRDMPKAEVIQWLARFAERHYDG